MHKNFNFNLIFDTFNINSQLDSSSDQITECSNQILLGL